MAKLSLECGEVFLEVAGVDMQITMGAQDGFVGKGCQEYVRVLREN